MASLPPAPSSVGVAAGVLLSVPADRSAGGGGGAAAPGEPELELRSSASGPALNPRDAHKGILFMGPSSAELASNDRHWRGVRSTHGVVSDSAAAVEATFTVRILRLGEEREDGIVRLGWSTELLLPADDLQAHEMELKDSLRLGRAPYVSFGCGSWGFLSHASRFSDTGVPFGMGDEVTSHLRLTPATPRDGIPQVRVEVTWTKSPSVRIEGFDVTLPDAPARPLVLIPALYLRGNAQVEVAFGPSNWTLPPPPPRVCAGPADGTPTISRLSQLLLPDGEEPAGDAEGLQGRLVTQARVRPREAAGRFLAALAQASDRWAVRAIRGLLRSTLRVFNFDSVFGFRNDLLALCGMPVAGGEGEAPPPDSYLPSPGEARALAVLCQYFVRDPDDIPPSLGLPLLLRACACCTELLQSPGERQELYELVPGLLGAVLALAGQGGSPNLWLHDSQNKVLVLLAAAQSATNQVGCRRAVARPFFFSGPSLHAPSFISLARPTLARSPSPSPSWSLWSSYCRT